VVVHHLASWCDTAAVKIGVPTPHSVLAAEHADSVADEVTGDPLILRTP